MIYKGLTWNYRFVEEDDCRLVVQLVASIYSFLREALRFVDEHTIYRAYIILKQGNYTYKNEYEGTLDYFYGHATQNKQSGQ